MIYDLRRVLAELETSLKGHRVTVIIEIEDKEK